MNQQSFIFCVGAAKAGTSWLFDYFYFHSQCYFPAVKELHYWDSLEEGSGGFYRKQSQKRHAWLTSRRAQETDKNVIAYQDTSLTDISRWHDAFDGNTRDDQAYLNFLQGDAEAEVIGDFTPSYSLLSEKTLQSMTEVTGRDNVKFIYLLRDPVDRLWSQIRMDAGGDSDKLLALYRKVINNEAPNVMDRSNYRRCINRLLRAVGADRLHVEFYEHLFTTSAIQRICDFVGIHSEPADFSKTINNTPGQGITDAERGRLYELLKPQYNFVQKFMGKLPEEWSKEMVTV